MARSTSSREVPRVALIVAAAALGAAAQQPAPAVPARFDGHDSTEWAQRLLGRGREAAIIGLAAGRGDSLPVLRELLVHRQNEVAWAAARALESMGPAAEPLSPLLLRELQQAPSWWTRMHCGNALAAIGKADREVLAALLQHATRSDVPRLRAECVAAYARLRPAGVVEDLLAAWRRGEFETREYAIDALERAGDRATDPLIAAIREHSPCAELAEDALLRRGFLVVPALERADLKQLAERALVAAPLRHVTFGEQFVAELPVQPEPLARLPAIEWVTGAGHGDSLEVCRAVEDADGLRVVSMRFLAGRDALTDSVAVRTAVVPRATASALARQLAVLPCLKLGLREPQRRDRYGGLFNSANFVAVVRVTDGARVVADGAWCGYPTSRDVATRFVPQAAIAVLGQALREATWQPCESSAGDRGAAAALVARLPDEEWTRARGKRLLELLAPR